MAIATDCGGFSIREYTASMRNRDVGKCWPFGGEVHEGMLPPIDCPKHRLWLAELQTIRSAVDGDYQAGPLSERIICHRGITRDRGAAEAAKEKRGLVKMKKAKTPKRKSVADLVPGNRIQDCEVDNQETVAAVGANPTVGQLETTDLEMSKKRRKQRSTVVNRHTKDFDGVVKKDILKLQHLQKQRKKRKMGSPVADKREEKRENSMVLPANGLPQVPSVSKVTCIPEMMKDKNSAGKRKLKPGNKKKTRKRTNLKKISELQESINSKEQDKMNPLDDVLRTQSRDQDGKDRSKNKIIGDTSGDNHKPMARSPPLQGLCRVLSDVLAASRASNTTSESGKISAGGVALNNKYPSSMQFQRSDDGDLMTNSERKDRSQSARRFDAMIDLNVPIDISSGKDEAVEDISSAIGKETINQGAGLDKNVSQPVVATVDSIHRTSDSPEPLKRGKLVNLNADCHEARSEESNLEAINKSWLTVMKEKMGKFVENYSRKELLNGMPITMRGDRLHVRPYNVTGSQNPRTKNYQARSPASNPLPGVNSSKISSSNQSCWKSPEKCFLESRILSVGKHGKWAGNLEPAGNLCRPLASESNACNGSSSSSYSHQAPSTMRLMGTDVTIGRNSRNDPCVDQRTTFLNKACGLIGFRGEGRSRLGSDVDSSQNQLSSNFGRALPVTRPVGNYFHQNNSQKSGFSQGQFIRGNIITVQDCSNACPGQGPLMGNQISPALVSEERSNRNPISFRKILLSGQ